MARIAQVTIAMIMGGLLAATTATARAAEWEQRLSRGYGSCLDRAGGVTMEMVGCVGEEMKGQDARLNAAYHALLKGLPPDRQEKVRAAQRKWIEYRQLNCESRIGSDTGSLATVEANECVLRMTVERSAELEQMAEP